MQLDVADLRDFYATALGQVARRVLSQRIRTHWRGSHPGTMLGLGFASPFLGPFRNEVTRLGALMPASQGALVWPKMGPVHTVLVEEDRLPIPDNSVERLLIAHCLEATGRVEALLRETWRILAPEGRLLIIVPNRRGVWARLDSTPFGQGRPFSRSQLESLLVQSLFTPLVWSGALYFPPVDRPLLLRSAMTVERIGARVSARVAGVIVVEAKKELVAPIGKRVATRAIKDLVTVRRNPILVDRN
jgi:SAM-dependent methyltransferase